LSLYTSSRDYCTIKGDDTGERFLKIGPNIDGVCVIEAKQGFIFDGKFNHAGARINYCGSKEASLMLKLEGQLRAHTVRKGKSKKSRTGNAIFDEDDAIFNEEFFDTLMDTSGLDRLCRFHCHILPKGHAISTEPNRVGRENCPYNAEL
jgi:hypothetical protein